jgi:hypothetical protein
MATATPLYPDKRAHMAPCHQRFNTPFYTKDLTSRKPPTVLIGRYADVRRLFQETRWFPVTEVMLGSSM